MGFDRTAALERLATEEFDVVVVGGGITGAGCALDAVSRGLKTALVERDDFAFGTSSRSSKLVHGGVRYLQHREFGLVREALAERQIALNNAPHLVQAMPFLIPIVTDNGLIDRRISRLLGAVLWMYDLSGGLRIKKAHKRVTKAEALARVPTLDPDRLASGYVYYDGQADDARLTLALARTAADLGAVVVNYAPAVAITKSASGRATGVRVSAEGREIEVRARAVVNAAGVWADDIRAFDEGAHAATLRPAKGVHITVPWDRVRNEIAMFVPVPFDGRAVFVIPWGDVTYIGTTDDDYDGDVDDPQCTADDVDYLLRAVNSALVDPLTPDDVIATWAGLRPLLATAPSEKTADLSRRHGIRVSGAGVVTITGGKLTTYRAMARDTIDQVDQVLDGQHRSCRTKKLPLTGARGYRAPAPDAPALDRHLAGRYGTEATAVRRLIAADPTLGEPLVPGLPYVRAEAVYAVREEMAQTLGDVLDRRTRCRILDRAATAAAAESVGRLLAPEWGWDDATSAAAVAAYRAE
ncbi:MAG: glycerol-3-phosphate dehydrogenase/oxidase, partial [Actinobacteria bacterium]|nr:glycerol-3-phosphate dehydrogenase/oxidase [Actinomycetota bacterium]